MLAFRIGTALLLLIAAPLATAEETTGEAVGETASEATRETGDEIRGDHASGVVFHDRNRNGARDAFDFGVRGVAVSNGRDVVLTDW